MTESILHGWKHVQQNICSGLSSTAIFDVFLPASKRHLMCQVSGLGMEDPVYGTRERGPSHASQIYDDMSVGNVAEDMKDVVSVASDHTATEGDGLDLGAFHASLMTIPTDISLETNNRHYSSFNAITDIRPGSPSSCLRFQSTTKAQKRPSLSSSRASNKTEPVPAQKNDSQWDPSHRTSSRSEIPSRPHATYIRRRNETMVEREIPLISLSLSDQQNLFSERRTKMLRVPSLCLCKRNRERKRKWRKIRQKLQHGNDRSIIVTTKPQSRPYLPLLSPGHWQRKYKAKIYGYPRPWHRPHLPPTVAMEFYRSFPGLTCSDRKNNIRNETTHAVKFNKTEKEKKQVTVIIQCLTAAKEW